jgi:hypothetical protein
VRPLVIIYWLRLVLGIIAASVSTALALMSDVGSTTTFINGITAALAVYLIGYYIIKAKFATKVEKQSKIMTQGIGVYFFTWLVFWILMYTIIQGPLPVVT